MCRIVDLPQSIFQELEQYFIENLTQEEIQNKRNGASFFYEVNLQENNESWRNLLSISNSFYWKSVVRRELYKFTLNRFYSQKYLFDFQFRKDLSTRMKDPYYQLSLDFSKASFTSISEEEGRVLSNLRLLNLSNNFSLSVLPKISHVHELVLSRCITLTDISRLEAITILNLADCEQIKDISMLQSIQDLSIDGSKKLKGFSKLKSVRKLSLSITSDALKAQVESMQNLTHLVNRSSKAYAISDLNLPNLENLDSFGTITSLSQVKNLEVLRGTSIIPKDNNFKMKFQDILRQVKVYEGCFDIFERFDKGFFQTCRHLRSLVLTKVPQTFSVRGLKHIPHLQFENSHITDADSLKTCKRLELAFCTGYESVSAFGKILELDICGNKDLKTLKGLGKGNARVGLSFCDRLVNVSALANVHMVKLDYCPQILDVSMLGNVVYLSLLGCTNVTDFSALGGPKQKMLNLTGCRHLSNTDLPRFKNVSDLRISFCPKITDISVLTPFSSPMKRLSCIKCLGLKAVSLRNSFLLQADFSYCENLKTVDIFGTVHGLCIYKSETAVNVYGKLNCVVEEFEFPCNERSRVELEYDDEFNAEDD
jgi:hypothetical protein